jgi:hypothetical protein
MRLLDKLLTVFIYLWVGFVVVCAVADIIWITMNAPSVWSGIGAVQEKWFDPFNIMHWIAEFIFVSPAFGAWYLREYLREKRGAKTLNGVG